MDAVNAPPGANDPGSAAMSIEASRSRRVAGVVVVVVVLVAATYAIYSQRHTFFPTLGRVGVGPVLGSIGFGLIGTGLTFPIWRQILAGLGARLPWGPASRVFFVGQLGKYLPGSVWPILIQMEAARNRGAGRRTVVATNLLTIVLSCVVGLSLGCLLLPIFDADAFRHYWWVLLALVPLLALLHPRAIPGALDRLLVLARRPPLGEHLEPRIVLEASGWSLASWIAFGAHLAVLVVAVGPDRPSTWLLCTGAMALAVPAGLLFLPAPAGAGVRELVLTLVLATVISHGSALAVVITSRVLLAACDMLLAGAAMAWAHRTQAPAPAA